MESVYRITLDTQTAGSQISLQCTKGDSGRVIEITLTENGNPFAPTSGAYAVFMVHKPDGHIIYNNADINDGRIICTITAQTTAAVGVSGCEIRVYDASGAVVTSARFDLLIDEPVYDDIQIQSTDEYIALADLVAQILDLIREYGDSVKKVNSKLPDETGAVSLAAGDIATQQSAWQYQGSIDGALDDLFTIYKTITDAMGNTVNGISQDVYEISDKIKGIVKSINGNVPDESGAVNLLADDIATQQSAWQYQGNISDALDDLFTIYQTITNSITGDVNAAQTTADLAKAYARAAQSTANAANDTAESAQAAANTAQATADAAQADAEVAVKEINLKTPTSGSVVINSGDILMEFGDYEDFDGYTITATVDILGERIDSKGGKVELVRSGNQIFRDGHAIGFRSLRDLLMASPEFVYMLDGDWAYLPTYIYGEPTDAYQYIRFSSTVIGDLKTKTSSIMIQTTNGGVSYTVTSSTINNENASNKSDMSVLNDTRYPTTKAVADYVEEKLAAIPWAEGVEFNA